MKQYFLDTNNILHAHPQWKSEIRSGIALQKLIAALSRILSVYPSYTYTLVLDTTHETTTSPHPSIKLVASNHADTTIKHMVAQTPNKSKCVVVSSDTEVFNYARIHAVEAIQSKEFIQELLVLATPKKQTSSHTTSSKEKPFSASRKDFSALRSAFSSPLEDDWDSTIRKK